ncbi:ribosome recycling factor [Caldicellulosiruptor naganoensis]|uniref:Ribosome-recycling factor n=1 Tax=Caldicellulosiruptor naganoensis TaxID=29324 RepID=A0ABY7BLC1_9FIRM|nr:ribosome recycling factor [Caldicellulosiruptor naganoensis]WAM32361.1 ribosome recycling factor [Caldicellulosiruptor naganoensis]
MPEPIQVAEEKMKKAVETLKREFATVKAGRANPHILDKVMVDYYGVPTPIPQLASITVPEARMIVIQPWEAKMLKEIEKAIQKADLGVNPANDGKVIRLIFPELTEERRKELVKQVKKMAEDAKVAIRNIRREALDEYRKMKKNNEITEDDLKDAEEDVQKLHDKYIEQIEKLLSAKEKEIMEV